jgi:hypothetical protein
MTHSMDWWSSVSRLNATSSNLADYPDRSLKVATRVRIPLGLQICRDLLGLFRLSAALFTVSTLTVESIEDRQDLEILGPSRRFLGSDDVTEVGDHDVDRVDLNQPKMSPTIADSSSRNEANNRWREFVPP